MTARIVLALLCISCAAYTGFVYRYSDTRPGLQAASSNALKGADVWQRKNCQSCHQLYGLGGYMGPDLTNVGSKGPGYMQSFMAHGTSRMPDFQLSDTEIAQLSSFLQWVDSSGHSRVPDSMVHWSGSYSIDP